MTEIDSSYRDSLATVSAEGNRIWIYPRQPKGWFYDRRKAVSYLLLLVLFGLPFIEINGQPIFLFNVVERHFRFFGITFTPQDFYLAGLTMVTCIVAITLFTVVFGRLFCGWICPQTIFMEMVFRRIEYAIEGSNAQQKRLNQGPLTLSKFWKKTLKHLLFFIVAILIANTFLSYIIGWRNVYEIATEPITQHVTGFVAMIGFSAIFYGVFSRLREQVCTSICPYGRLQSVLVDDDTIGVMYDELRGEPRGKIKKRKNLSENEPIPQIVKLAIGTELPLEDVRRAGASERLIVPATKPIAGDCVDCKACIKVCPTGIDIRDGFNQLECVHCTACIDACDDIMDKLDRPRGLIRYESRNGLATKRKRLFTKRAYAYVAVLLGLLVLNSFLLTNRSSVSLTIVRTPGMTTIVGDDGELSNLYNYQVYNKSSDEIEVDFKLLGMNGLAAVRLVGERPIVAAGKQARGSFFIDFAAGNVNRKVLVDVELIDINTGKAIDEAGTTFLNNFENRE